MAVTEDPASTSTTGRGRRRAVRRIVLLVRVVLGIVVLIATGIAGATSDSDVDTSDRATGVLVAALTAILLGGLFQPPDSELPPHRRRRARYADAGRRARALVAASSLVVFALMVLKDHDTAATAALFVLVASPLVLPIALGLWRLRALPEERTEVTVRRQQAPPRVPVPPPRSGVLVPSPPGGRGTATVRPAAPAGPNPWGMGAWLRRATITADVSAVHVTDAAGTTRSWPRDGAPGSRVHGLGICREALSYWNPNGGGWSLPEYRERLVLLTADRRRLADLELYGWTGSALTAFAAATGLELTRHEIAGVHRDHTDLFGRKPPTPLERALPPANGYVRVAGRRRWPLVLAVVAAFVGAIVLLALVGVLAFLAGSVASQWSPTAARVAAGVTGAAGLALFVRGARTATERARARRRTATTYPDQP